MVGPTKYTLTSPGKYEILDENPAAAYKLAKDRQVGGGHYKDMPIQPTEFIMKNGIGWCAGNAIKYICRHNLKGGITDIDKAIHYLELLKEEYHAESDKG